MDEAVVASSAPAYGSRVEFLAELPRNSTGKVLKAAS